MKAREGDLIETKTGIIFDVKGLVQPRDRIIAYPRFIPDSSGNRKRKQVSYRKVYALAERLEFLEKTLPHYIVRDSVLGETLCEVPVEDVDKLYTPVEKLKELRGTEDLDRLERLSLQMTELLRENAKIPFNTIGVSGSLMAGLHTSASDIDLVVYGSDNCRKAYSALEMLLKDKNVPLRRYTKQGLRKLFDFRSKDTAVGFEDFIRTESRKVSQGKFLDKDYFIRFVKEWNEVEEYGDISYSNAGYARIKARIADASESIFTPCTYNVDNVQTQEGDKREPISEIVSFRGRFCEQAEEGEIVVAQGKIEKVVGKRNNDKHFRLLLGNKTSDYMVLDTFEITFKTCS
jgi:predicted nucleotidyltransferase